MMYAEEMDTWLAEERLEEARSQARLVAALLRDRHQSGGSTTGADEGREGQDEVRVTSEAVPDVAINTGETVQVVEDEDEVTTIRRPILPDVRS